MLFLLGCLKNYCECYEAKIPCTASCRCSGCHNLDVDSVVKKEARVTSTTSTVTSSATTVAAEAQARNIQSLRARLTPFTENGAFKLPEVNK